MTKPRLLAIIQNQKADGSWEFSGKKVAGYLSLLNFFSVCWANKPEHIVYAAGAMVSAFFALKVWEGIKTQPTTGGDL